MKESNYCPVCENRIYQKRKFTIRSIRFTKNDGVRIVHQDFILCSVECAKIWADYWDEVIQDLQKAKLQGQIMSWEERNLPKVKEFDQFMYQRNPAYGFSGWSSPQSHSLVFTDYDVEFLAKMNVCLGDEEIT